MNLQTASEHKSVRMKYVSLSKTINDEVTATASRVDCINWLSSKP